MKTDVCQKVVEKYLCSAIIDKFYSAMTILLYHISLTVLSLLPLCVHVRVCVVVAADFSEGCG